MLSNYTDAEFYRLLTIIVISKQFIITAIFVLITLGVMFAYRKALQRIDVELSHENMGFKASLTLLIPVLLLLTLLGFSYVILSSPITISHGSDSVVAASAATPPPQSSTSNFLPDQNIRDLSLAIAALTNNQNQQVGTPESREMLSRLVRWRNSLVFSRFPETEVASVIRGEPLADANRQAEINFLMGK